MTYEDMAVGFESAERPRSPETQNTAIDQIADEGTLAVLSSIINDCIKNLAETKEEPEQRNALGEAFNSVFFLGCLSASAPRSKR